MDSRVGMEEESSKDTSENISDSEEQKLISLKYSSMGSLVSGAGVYCGNLSKLSGNLLQPAVSLVFLSPVVSLLFLSPVVSFLFLSPVVSLRFLSPRRTGLYLTKLAWNLK